jgi:hypothetical protein
MAEAEVCGDTCMASCSSTTDMRDVFCSNTLYFVQTRGYIALAQLNCDSINETGL